MSPRTEETNARIREEQKERILEAAKAIFAHKGFSETKMSDIATAANVSYGLAYHYFANKEAIFTSLLQKALQGALELMQRARVQPGTPWDRLHWLTSEIVRGAQDEPEFDMLVLQALTNHTVPRETHKMVLQESQLSHEALKLHSKTVSSATELASEQILSRYRPYQRMSTTCTMLVNSFSINHQTLQRQLALSLLLCS